MALLQMPTINKITLHGLGKQVARCCDLAMRIHEANPTMVRLLPQTGTVDLIDEVPCADELTGDYSIHHRKNSAIYIEIQKYTVEPLPNTNT